MKDPLFEPITINTLTLENRIYLRAMHLGMGVDYEVTDAVRPSGDGCGAA